MDIATSQNFDWIPAQNVAGSNSSAKYAVLLMDESVRTPVLLSLFTDRRATKGDNIPAGDNPRGWAGAEDRQYGSGLWLLEAGKQLPRVLASAEFEAQEALVWAIEQKIAARIQTKAQFIGDAMHLDIRLYSAGDQNPIVHIIWEKSL